VAALGVTDGLGRSEVALQLAGGLRDSQVVSGVAGGLAGYGWPLGVVDGLGGSQAAVEGRRWPWKILIIRGPVSKIPL
jgi:hypothetical protein